MDNPIERKRGVIKTVFAAKKFGFIQVTKDEEYFFHQSALQGVAFKDLIAGDIVTFIPTVGPAPDKRNRAVGVRREADGEVPAADTGSGTDSPATGASDPGGEDAG